MALGIESWKYLKKIPCIAEQMCFIQQRLCCLSRPPFKIKPEPPAQPRLAGAWGEPCKGSADKQCLTWCLSRAMAVRVSVETWSEQYCTKRLMWHMAFPKIHVLFTNRTWEENKPSVRKSVGKAPGQHPSQLMLFGWLSGQPHLKPN